MISPRFRSKLQSILDLQMPMHAELRKQFHNKEAAVLITDADGAELFSGSLDQEPPFMKPPSARRTLLAPPRRSTWENEGGAGRRSATASEV